MNRVSDWQRRLNAHLIEWQRLYAERGVQWGEVDCCLFAAGWVMSATGVDPMADYRGEYASQDEALARLRATGDGTLIGALTRLFGDPVHPASARRGDIVFRKADRSVGVVVTIGARQAGMFLGEGGFAEVSMRDCDMGFRVG